MTLGSVRPLLRQAAETTKKENEMPAYKSVRELALEAMKASREEREPPFRCDPENEGCGSTRIAFTMDAILANGTRTFLVVDPKTDELQIRELSPSTGAAVPCRGTHPYVQKATPYTSDDLALGEFAFCLDCSLEGPGYDFLAHDGVDADAPTRTVSKVEILAWFQNQDFGAVTSGVIADELFERFAGYRLAGGGDE